MENFTIHIFGYGETQINSKDLSVKVSTDTLTTVTPLVDAIWNKKPLALEIEEKYHVIHIFGYNNVRWLSKEGFDVKNDEQLKLLIDDLIAELETKTTTTTTTVV